ncbi:MAG TPA: histidine kinase [Candidatus Baltobacteraceae bacterium]|jgi:signal transduction histidine kinase|nr:histidine kinase [Candidatus Baltobacteraceae bacterium]
MRSRRFRTFLLLFALYSAVGTLLFASGYLDDLSRGHYGTAPRRLTEEFVGAYTALALLPFVIWFARRFRIRMENWPLTVALTVGAALCYSAAHTSLNAVVRDAVSVLTGQGRYDYGTMFYRYPMEASKDIIYFFIMVGCINFIDGVARARKAEVAAVELQTRLAEAKLENLRLQLHPHFLFNTLNAISAVMYEDVARADEMLTKLSDFLRHVLASSGVHEVPLAEELAVERMYVDIMRTRLERQLSLGVHVEEDAREAAIPFMLLQPLLENSIRHGMSELAPAIHLDIDVRRRNGSTVVRVSDNGTGIIDGWKPGIGLQNVESRLSHMYGADSRFTIEPLAGGGTCATLTFPFSQAGAA